MVSQNRNKVSNVDYRIEYVLKDKQSLTLRSPNVDDAGALIEYMKTVDTESPFLAREPGEFNLTVEQERDFIKKSTGNENSFFILGEVGGEIAGNCAVAVIQNKKRFMHRAVMGIAVKKAYWRLGIGSILMQQCVDWCAEKGIEQLELDVVTENTRALSMYKQFGFEVYGTKKHAMKYSDGTYADEYSMILFLEK